MESPHCSPRCAVLQLALLLLLVMSTRDNWYEAYLTDLYGCAQFGAFNLQSCDDAMVRHDSAPTTPSASSAPTTPTNPSSHPLITIPPPIPLIILPPVKIHPPVIPLPPLPPLPPLHSTPLRLQTPGKPNRRVGLPSVCSRCCSCLAGSISPA